MGRYLIRRVLYAIPILIGVMLLTFFLFFGIVKPDALARHNLSSKNPTQAQIHDWLAEHGYDKPMPEQFKSYMVNLATFNFGKSDRTKEPIWDRIKAGAIPSFQIASMVLLTAVVVSITLAMVSAYFRGTYVDRALTFFCVALLSITYVFYVLGMQYLLGKILRYGPLAGYQHGVDSWRFIVIPMIIGVTARIGGDIRLYRTFLLDEINQDYVRTARAKGVRESMVLFKHVLKNAMIPVLTTTVAIIPTLILGSIILESFFGIPGIGGYLQDAISNQDFAVVRAMVYLGTVLYIIGFILTDVLYAAVDPEGETAMMLTWDWVEDASVVFIPVVLGWAIVRAKRQPLWSEAYRRLSKNKVAIASVCVLAIYLVLALLDGIGWHSPEQIGRRTVIDVLFSKPLEHTYSAPLASITAEFRHPQKLVAPGSHLLGTDAVGTDVLYQTIKGMHTALFIGGLTTLIATPLALFLGLIAGYFGKFADDVVQYTYTVFASVPDILLLIAIILVLGQGLFPICFALGVTSWVGLCRLVRGETLRQREREYVLAAQALGVKPGRILVRHILPNLLPMVIISVTLAFSSIVLAEAILSYLGVGVGADVASWGNMIDGARDELTRDPLVWWNLASATTALMILVLALNLFADALRDAIDPRLRSA